MYFGAINDGRPAKPHPDREKLRLARQPPTALAWAAPLESLRIAQLLRRWIVPLPSPTELLKEQGYQVVTPQSGRDGTYTMRVPLAELAAQLAVPCVDARAAVRAAPGGTAAHHVADSRVHPNAAVHRLIAELVADRIARE